MMNIAFTLRSYADGDFAAALAAVNACMRADGEPVKWSEAEFSARLIDPRRRRNECLVAEIAGVVACVDVFFAATFIRRAGE